METARVGINDSPNATRTAGAPDNAIPLAAAEEASEAVDDDEAGTVTNLTHFLPKSDHRHECYGLAEEPNHPEPELSARAVDALLDVDDSEHQGGEQRQQLYQGREDVCQQYPP